MEVRHIFDQTACIGQEYMELIKDKNSSLNLLDGKNLAISKTDNSIKMLLATDINTIYFKYLSKVKASSRQCQYSQSGNMNVTAGSRRI